MKKFVQQYIDKIAWSLAITVAGISLVGWGQRINWQLAGLSNYDLFPLFGLLAFSLMWCHYIIEGLKTGFQINKEVDRRYFEVTAWVVLVALLLHPWLFIGQLFIDGFGLPPSSYKAYIMPGLSWAIFLGVISWWAFMAFELRRKYETKKWWKYVLYANDIAIWLVYIHALRLGADLAAGWLRAVWIIFGLLLAAAFGVIYHKKLFAKISV